MAERKDEPAFAAIATSPAGDVYHQTGMTLRDWFAGQALAGSVSRAMINPAERATQAYRYADAMLAERSKP